MQMVTSADGTQIAYERFGDGGPALLKIGGAFCDRSFAGPLTDALADRFCVYGYDRRGRGDSGARATQWSIQRELEDLAAVLAAIEPVAGPVSVYGHSSGAALALEAAAAQAPVIRLAVYEPPYTGAPGSSLTRAAELQSLVDAGDLDATAALFLRGTGMPEERVTGMRGWSGWPAMVAQAPTLPHEVGLCNDGAVPTQRLSAIGCPVLALAGADSPDWASDGATAIAAAAPDGLAHVLSGQDHNVSADPVAPLLADFFAASRT